MDLLSLSDADLLRLPLNDVSTDRLVLPETLPSIDAEVLADALILSE
ncbi:hypothetical protein ACKN8S_06705 [Limosilactobacillus reuteri]